MTTFNLFPLTQEKKEEIAAWKYPGDYAMYDLPDAQAMKKAQMGFYDPKKSKNYYGLYVNNSFAGFANICPEEKEVFIGIGIKPELCNKGYGSSFMTEVYSLSKKLYPDKPLYLEVRSWNQRAINCYKKAGFMIAGEPFEQTTRIGKGSFYRMVKD